MTADEQAPDPDDVQYLADLLSGLRSLRTLSYQRCEDVSKQRSPRAGYPVLAKTTVYNMLTGNKLPSEDRLLSYLVVCEVPVEERQRWLAAHRRVRNDHDGVAEHPDTSVAPPDGAGPADSANPTEENGGPGSTESPPDPDRGAPPSTGASNHLGIRVFRRVPHSFVAESSAYHAHEGRPRRRASRRLVGKRCVLLGSALTLAVLGLAVGCYYAVVAHEVLPSFQVNEFTWMHRHPDYFDETHVGHFERGAYEFSCWTKGVPLSVYDSVDRRGYSSEIWVRAPVDSTNERDVYISALSVSVPDDRHPDVRTLLPRCSWNVFD